MAGQVRNPDVGQDEETHVVSDAGQPALACSLIPADEPVATGDAPSGSAIEQTAQHTFLAIIDQILQVLTNRAAVAQIVVLLQEHAKQLYILFPSDLENPQGLEICYFVSLR